MPCLIDSLSASILAYLSFLSSSCCLSASCLSSSFFAASGSSSFSSPPSILPTSGGPPERHETKKKHIRHNNCSSRLSRLSCQISLRDTRWQADKLTEWNRGRCISQTQVQPSAFHLRAIIICQYPMLFDIKCKNISVFGLLLALFTHYLIFLNRYCLSSY